MQVNPALVELLSSVETDGNSCYLVFKNGCVMRGKRSWLVEKIYNEGDVLSGAKPSL